MPPCPTRILPKPLAMAISRRSDGLAIEEPSIAANDQRRTFKAFKTIHDRLDKVLDITRLLEGRGLFAKTRSPGL